MNVGTKFKVAIWYHSLRSSVPEDYPDYLLSMTQWGWYRRTRCCKSVVPYCSFRQIPDYLVTVALSRYPDIEVEIFEGAEKLAELGAGIGLFPRRWISA